MAQHKGGFTVAMSTLAAGTKTHIARIKGGTNVGLVLEQLDFSFDSLGDEPPIAVHLEWDPSTPGTDGSAQGFDNKDDNYPTTFVGNWYTGTTGQSTPTRVKNYYIGPGGGTLFQPIDVQGIKAGGILDIYVTRKSGATGTLNGHLNGDIEE
jgi:hypothetical protein